MDQVESEFLKTQIHQLLVWFSYTDDKFYFWIHVNDKLEQFLVDLNKFHPTSKSVHESSRKNLTFLDVYVKFLNLTNYV